MEKILARLPATRRSPERLRMLGGAVARTIRIQIGPNFVRQVVMVLYKKAANDATIRRPFLIIERINHRFTGYVEKSSLKV